MDDRRDAGRSVFWTTLALLLGLVVAFPFLWMILTSLKTYGEANAYPPTVLPATPTLGNFPEVFRECPLFGRYILNSLFVAFLTTGLVIVTSALAGYGLGRFKFRGEGVLFGAVLASLFIPFEVTLIPNYRLIQALKLKDTYAALVLPWGASALGIFLVRQFFRSLPSDVWDAARLDGCGHFRFLWRIALPMAKAPLFAVAVWTFLGSWNSLLWPLVVTDSPEMRTLAVGVKFFLDAEQARPHVLMAGAALSLLPIALLYLFLGRRILESQAAWSPGG